MRRFFDFNFGKEQKDFSSFIIRQDAHHLINVLRVCIGDTFELTNANGVVATVKVVSLTKKEIQVQVIEIKQIEKKKHQIVLACAIPKKAKFDIIIEKAVELGADIIIPMITKRTQMSVDLSRLSKKDERFLKIAIETIKQTKSAFLPEVFPIMPFEKAVEYCQLKKIKMFIPWLGEDGNIPAISLQQCLQQEKESSVAFFIGPEGDFTLEEVSFAQQYLAVPVSLGKNVLKVDTACFYCLSLAQAFLNE